MPRYREPFLLSSTGSTRATAYNWGNKSITIDGQTHVVWLDAISTVCARTYDHASGRWSETFRLLEGCDNHANPSITADRHAHLRLVFGPHGWYGDWNQARCKWVISEQPNCVAAWKWEQSFGYNATAPSIVHTPSDLDAVVYRGGEPPCSLMFTRQRPLGGWSSARELMRQEIEPQYTHHYGHVTCDGDGTLYAACHFYNVGGGHVHPVTGPRDRMRSYGMAILKSADLGETWTDLRDEPVATPTLYEERIAIPPVGADMYVDGIAVDPRSEVWALVKQSGIDDRRFLLNHWLGSRWETFHLEDNLPDGRLTVDSALTIDTQSTIHVVVTALRPDEVGNGEWWGHPSCEVFHLCSDDGGRSFECNLVSTPDKTTANWLPNISKSGPFHPVEQPVIVYTHGEPGQGCRPETQTEVLCVMVE